MSDKELYKQTAADLYKKCDELRDSIHTLSGRLIDAGKQLEKYQWVFVKDRMPDDHKDVLVWFEYFRYGDYNCLFQRYGIGNYLNKTWFVNGETGWKQLRVIAWQKLPEPPKE